MILNAINAKHVGESLQKAREQKGMTRKEIARIIHKRERYIENIEKGLNNNFDLEKICSILGVEVDNLCEPKTDVDTDGLDVTDRMILASAYRNTTLQHIFKNMGITSRTRCAYTTKATRVPDDIVKNVANELNVSYKWLSTGHGDNPLIPSNISEFGNYLRMERTKQKLSQHQLANRCGWRNGALVARAELHPEKCRNRTILNILKALKIDPEIFTKIDFGDIDKSPLFIDKTRLMTYNTANRKEVFARRVREARKIKNMSQRDLAAKLNCSQTTISFIETNKVCDSIISTSALADALGTSEDWLWGGDSKPPLTDDDLKNKSIETEVKPAKTKKRTTEKHVNKKSDVDDPVVEKPDIKKLGANKPTVEKSVNEKPTDNKQANNGSGSESVDIQSNQRTNSLCDLIIVKLKELNESNLVKVYDRIIELEKLDKYERMKNNE